MDKIDREKRSSYYRHKAVDMLNADIEEMYDKLDELIEGYDKIMVKIVKMHGRIDNIMLKL